MEPRLGQVLVEMGVLSESQTSDILAEQERTGEPFGLLCERMFGIDPQQVERAWAAQYSRMAKRIDPASEAVDVQAQSLVTRRQAWQFRVLPLRFDGKELMIATTPGHLRRALRFATAVIGVPVYLVMCSPEQLGEALCRHYPLPGMTPQSIFNAEETALLS